MANMFTGIGKPKNPGEPSKPINVHAVLGKIILIIAFVVVVGYALFNLFGFAVHIAANWKEIQFAYNKPAVVRTVRTQYEKKSVALDSQFTSNKPSETDQVLGQIKAALGTPSK